MKIELPSPKPLEEAVKYLAPGVTSPYAHPPLERVFIIGMRDGGRITLSNAEARELHSELATWIESQAPPGLDDRGRVPGGGDGRGREGRRVSALDEAVLSGA